MKRFQLFLLLCALAAVTAGYGLFASRPQAAGLPAGDDVAFPKAASFRILMGLGDVAPTAWDGSVTVSGGRILSIDGWRFAEDDSTDSVSSWKLSTRRGVLAAAAKKKAQAPMLENGVTVTAALDTPQDTLSVKTGQGSFSFTPQQVPWNQPLSLLNDRVRVDRVPATVQLTSSPEEQDHPALAQTDDAIYLAYIEFVHGDRKLARQGQYPEEPKEFDFLARPAGGDQVFLMRFDKARRTWAAPVAVSAPGGDFMRAAVAVDGQRRVWVFWSANKNGNFDIYARRFTGSQGSPELRLTTDAGTDLNPAASTDAKGRIWLAWQAYRGGNLEILAAAQDGDGFTPEAIVSFSKASDWDPSLAASPGGEVAVAWDTYDKGDYDVYFRRMRWQAGAGPRIAMDPPVPIAAGPNFEARATIAYDAQNRLWAAYEASSTAWGKDFGAYEKSGVALYQGHNLRLKCFQGTEAFTTAAPLADALPGSPAAESLRKIRAKAALKVPVETGERQPGMARQAPPGTLNAFPRLAADAGGILLLAYRAPGGNERSPVGTIWHEQVSWFDGESWQGPVQVVNSDGLLDSRPAIAATGKGEFLLAGTRDHRISQDRRGARRAADAINTDIVVAELRLDTPARAPKLAAAPKEAVSAIRPEDRAESDQIAAMRAYRLKTGGAQYRLVRGEFHRHTEISGDGGRDGPVIDAYRYLIDSASMDWGGCCDHDNGGGREYYWWIEQKLTDAYRLEGRYTAMFSYERSVRYPEGHRNLVFAQRGIRPLARLPKVADDAPPAPAPDTQMLYRYLRRFKGIAASHTSGTDMGTDWRDNDPIVEPVVEIYQGDRQNYEMPDAPRSNNEKDSIGGWRPLGFVSLALQKGYKLGFQSSSDHISTHMSYCNLWVTEPTRAAIMEAFGKRRVYGATDNILADVRCGNHLMGEEFAVSQPPSVSVKLRGTAAFAKVHIIKDGIYAYTVEPGRAEVDFTWRDAAAEKGKTSYYYVRGEQADGELVWVSPMWITYR